MRCRLAVLVPIAILGISRPGLAQIVVSTHPPLSPADAVSVLRSSHSWSDMANRPIVDRDGPRIYVLPYDPSIDVPPMMAPPEPLSLYGSTSSYGGWLGGWAPYPYAPFDGTFVAPRFPAGRHRRPTVDVPRVAPPHAPAPPPSRAVMVAPASGGGVRRR